MLQLNILLLIISLLIFTIISTVYEEVKKYIVTKQIKTIPLKRGNIASPVLEGNIEREKTVTKKAFSFVTFKWI